MPRRVERTRNGGTWTEAKFWGWLRSGLRRMSIRWAPRSQVLLAARRPNESDNAKLKWEYQCHQCSGWFPRKEVEADHIIPAGTLKCLEDLPGFVDRLFCEVDGFEVKCKECHHKKTHAKE